MFITVIRSYVFRGKYEAIVLDNNITTFSGVQKWKRFICTLIKLLIILIKEKPAVVHTQISQSSFFKDTLYLLISKILGKKTVGHFHVRPDLFTTLPNIMQKYILSCSRFIDVAAVLTPGTQSLFQQRGWKKKIISIPNVVQVSDYTTSTRSSAETIVLHIGRLSSDKGLFTIIKIAKILRSLPIKFVLAGPFDRKEEKAIFFEEISDIDNIEWVGVVTGTAKTKLMVNSSFFLLPTQHKGEVFPVVLIESGAANLTVLVSSIGSIPEIIRDMDNGIFIDMQEPERIAEQIRWLYKNPDRARALADALHNEVVLKYSTEILDKVLLSLYSTLLKEIR